MSSPASGHWTWQSGARLTQVLEGSRTGRVHGAVHDVVGVVNQLQGTPAVCDAPAFAPHLTPDRSAPVRHRSWIPQRRPMAIPGPASWRATTTTTAKVRARLTDPGAPRLQPPIDRLVRPETALLERRLHQEPCRAQSVDDSESNRLADRQHGKSKSMSSDSAAHVSVRLTNPPICAARVC